MNADISLLKTYLTPTFISDVQNGSPQTIVSKYGTHVLSDIVLGAKLEVLYRSETSKSDRSEASAAGIDVGIKSIFSINTGYTYNSTQTSQNTNQTLHYKTIGGEPSQALIGEIPIGGTAPTINISNWQNSSSLSNAELIDIKPGGLIPIYDLINDPAKSAAVKAYVEDYLEANQAKGLGDVPIYVYYNAPSLDHYFTPNNQPTIGDGWFLNQGIAFYAFANQASQAVPIYVYYNASGYDHYFTPENSPSIGGGTLVNQGIAFYAYNTHVPGSVPIYVYYNAQGLDHYFTPENSPTIGGGTLVNQGIAFYAFPK